MCRTVLRFVTDCQELDSNFCVSLNCDFVSLGERCIYICIYTTRREKKKGAVEKYAGLSVAVELEYTCIYHFSFNKWRVVFQLENMAVSTALKTFV